jgi:hypothetical protein
LVNKVIIEIIFFETIFKNKMIAVKLSMIVFISDNR